jgi:hypothetical protein
MSDHGMLNGAACPGSKRSGSVIKCPGRIHYFISPQNVT